ncbi:MFS transporter [Burkholderia multivorans]|uniref:MFS transporter n=1 Tax=Burkholderia multivorans TaxID=87883 RepID=UPI002ED471C1|nr:MFS transporter [Burkholderia multivorans]
MGLFYDENLPAEEKKQIRTVIFSALAGTAVEYYDFFIFATASAVVFPQLFFPNLSPTMGLMASYATLMATFVARPLGAILFGHLGDKVGRKKSLVPSLIICALSTFLIGLLPTYAQIGQWAPFLIVVLRFVQGIGVGGEYGGATAALVEYAPPGKRGLFGAIVPLGNVLGVFISTLVFSLIPHGWLMSGGWRIPFLFSIVLLIIGVYVRTHLKETPLFLEMKRKGHTAPKTPIGEVLRSGKRSVLLTIGCRIGESALGWTIVGFLLSYATKTVGLSRDTVLEAQLTASAVALFTWPALGWLSDRVGRRPVFIGGALLAIASAFPFFWMVNSGSTVLFFIAVIFGYAILNGALYAIQPAFFSELFPTNVRSTGIGLGYQIANFMGFITPILATGLVALLNGKSWGISVYLIAALLVTIGCVSACKESSKMDLSKDETFENDSAPSASHMPG